MSTLLPANRDPRSPNWPHRRLQAARFVPPLIARVLADEFWFGNKPPGWPGAPTANDAKKARKRHIKRLKRFSPQFPEAAKLAKLLARCKRRRRCMNGACPECGRAFQRFFVSEVKDLASNKSLLKLIAVSIAFPHHRTADDELDMLNTTKMKRDVTGIINNYDDVRWVAGGIDISLNDDTQRNVPIRWQGQLYGFTEVSNREQFSKLLRDTFKKTRKVKRPIQTGECDVLISGNFLRIQERFRPAYRLPRASRSTRKPQNMLENAKSVTAAYRACSSNALAPQDWFRGAIVPARRAHDAHR